MGKYNRHRKAKFGMDNERLTNIPERVTFLTFGQWQTFYNADPEHWIDCKNSNYNSITSHNLYHLPVYKTKEFNRSTGSCWTFRYIKFLTRRDYIKYLRFMRQMEKKGEDYQNSQEIMALAEAVRQESAKRVEALQKEQAEAIRRNQEIIDNMDNAADLINFMIRGGQEK